MSIPNDRMYTKSHEWVKFSDEGTASVGITDFAQHAMGDLVFINLPKAGDPVTQETSFADVESVKAVSDIYSPVSGEITAVNDAAADNPELLNSAPYETWLIKVSAITGKTALFTPEEYAKLCEEEK